MVLAKDTAAIGSADRMAIIGLAAGAPWRLAPLREPHCPPLHEQALRSAHPSLPVARTIHEPMTTMSGSSISKTSTVRFSAIRDGPFLKFRFARIPRSYYTPGSLCTHGINNCLKLSIMLRIFDPRRNQFLKRSLLRGLVDPHQKRQTRFEIGCCQAAIRRRRRSRRAETLLFSSGDLQRSLEPGLQRQRESPGDCTQIEVGVCWAVEALACFYLTVRRDRAEEQLHVASEGGFQLVHGPGVVIAPGLCGDQQQQDFGLGQAEEIFCTANPARP